MNRTARELRGKEVVNMIFNRGLSAEEVAFKTGWSFSTIQKILRDYRDKAKKEGGKNE